MQRRNSFTPLLMTYSSSPWKKSQTLPFLSLCLDWNAFSSHSAHSIAPHLPAFSPHSASILPPPDTCTRSDPLTFPLHSTQISFLLSFLMSYILIFSLCRNLTFLRNSRKSSAVGSIMGKQQKSADGRRVSPEHQGKALLITLTEEKVFDM